MKTVDLPVRGFISTDSNGRQSVMMVKTGSGGVSATLPVLSAVRDKTNHGTGRGGRPVADHPD
ncbi:S-type pyocin domain-containing protein [Klebsiella michiganensis]|uniref:S-type pyocin domain-containing protein n=1 Tax=Klebsiella michiganensis TaxID=1134687 RepID=UPI001D0D550D|nr:S-type pyocin domain-containing protein [Klebsiella michiganensis]